MQHEYALSGKIDVVQLPVGQVIVAMLNGESVLIAAVPAEPGAGALLKPIAQPPGASQQVSAAALSKLAETIQVPTFTTIDPGWTTALVVDDPEALVFEHTGYAMRVEINSPISVVADEGVLNSEVAAFGGLQVEG